MDNDTRRAYGQSRTEAPDTLVHLTSPYRLPEPRMSRWIEIQTKIHERGSYRGGADLYEELEWRLLDDLQNRTGWTGTLHTTRSGMEALEFSLRAVGAGPGTVVAAPAFAYHAVGAAIHAVGASARWCDIDPDTWQLTADTLDRAGAHYDAIVLAVDNFGALCPIDDLARWCSTNGSRLVLDACESFGATRAFESAVPDAIALSFSFTKPVHAFGSGGAAILPDRGRSSTSLEDSAYIERRKLPAQNAAYLLLAMEDLDEAVGRLAHIHDSYLRKLEPIGLIAQKACSGGIRLHAPFLATTTLDRDSIWADLREARVETKLQWPLQNVMFGHTSSPMRTSDKIANRVLSLPSGSGMTDEEMTYVLGLFERRL